MLLVIEFSVGPPYLSLCFAVKAYGTLSPRPEIRNPGHHPWLAFVFCQILLLTREGFPCRTVARAHLHGKTYTQLTVTMCSYQLPGKVQRDYYSAAGHTKEYVFSPTFVLHSKFSPMAGSGCSFWQPLSGFGHPPPQSSRLEAQISASRRQFCRCGATSDSPSSS